MHQAGALLGTDDTALAAAALRLVDQALSDFPDNFYGTLARQHRGRALLKLDRLDAALEAFRDGIASQRAFPNVKTTVWLDFAWTVAEHGIQPHFDEATTVLQEFAQDGDLVFPATAYRYFGALAFISESLGDIEYAKRCAKNAIEQASKSVGPFTRHPDAGVVNTSTASDSSQHRLWRIAAG